MNSKKLIVIPCHQVPNFQSISPPKINYSQGVCTIIINRGIGTRGARGLEPLCYCCIQLVKLDHQILILYCIYSISKLAGIYYTKTFFAYQYK